jgi:hypothetical protein
VKMMIEPYRIEQLRNLPGSVDIDSVQRVLFQELVSIVTDLSATVNWLETRNETLTRQNLELMDRIEPLEELRRQHSFDESI